MSGDIIGIVVVFAVALVAFFSLFNNLVKARLIEDTPTSKIRSASQGYTELSGFAERFEDNMLVAPLTGQPCLWYHYTIERYESSGKNRNWRTLEKKTSDQFFALRDNTGECAVDPAKADVSTSWSKSWRGHNRWPTSTETATSVLGMALSGNYRYTEKIIRDQDYLYALGYFQSLHAASPEQQQKQKATELLNHWKQDYDQLLARFDADANGELDLEEWEQARQAAYGMARDYVLDNYSDEAVHVLAYTPERRKPYIISNKDPRELSRHYRLKAFGMAVLFVLCAGLGIYLLAGRHIN